MKLIGISGGIGSGKSVVSRVLSVKGYPVYDCDRNARRIMEENRGIHVLLHEHIHPDAVVDCKINRQLLSAVVFSNPTALQRLKSIVHKAVFEDLLNWKESFETSGVAFVESAILRSSGLYKYVDEEWMVTAPKDIRIRRVMERSGLTREQIENRIKSQACEEKTAHDLIVRTIDNSGEKSVISQLHDLLDSMPIEKRAKS